MGTIRRLKSKNKCPNYFLLLKINNPSTKAVLVIDKKVQKFLKVREMACQEIEAVSVALNVNLQVYLLI